MIRLDRNESPYPPSPVVREILSKYVDQLNRYDVEELREELLYELENYTGVSRNYIEFYPGSSHPLLLMIAIAKVKGLELLIPHPTFHVLYGLAESFGVSTRLFKLSKNFELDSDGFLRFTEGRLVYLANPNNPTGNLLFEDPDFVKRIASRAVLVFIDEAYYEFSGFTVGDLVPMLDNLVVTRTLSKAFSVAGARFGYVIAGRKAMSMLEALRVGFETSILSQAVALASLRDKGYMEMIVERIKSTRDMVRRRLLELGFWSPESRTNFLFIHVGEPCGRVWRTLGEQGILTLCLGNVRGFENYSEYLRVTIGKPEEMRVFLDALLRATAGGSR
ncbi:MAG: histidinol-phosphate transaminase [Candidatus Nezhaarchaeales archaeon]